jgi:hypothetical protein
MVMKSCVFSSIFIFVNGKLCRTSKTYCNLRGLCDGGITKFPIYKNKYARKNTRFHKHLSVDFRLD